MGRSSGQSAGRLLPTGSDFRLVLLDVNARTLRSMGQLGQARGKEAWGGRDCPVEVRKLVPPAASTEQSSLGTWRIRQVEPPRFPQTFQVVEKFPQARN